MSWGGGKGGRVVSWEGGKDGRVVRWSCRKGGTIVRWQGWRGWRVVGEQVGRVVRDWKVREVGCRMGPRFLLFVSDVDQ